MVLYSYNFLRVFLVKDSQNVVHYSVGAGRDLDLESLTGCIEFGLVRLCNEMQTQ